MSTNSEQHMWTLDNTANSDRTSKRVRKKKKNEKKKDNKVNMPVSSNSNDSFQNNGLNGMAVVRSSLDAW